MTRQHQRADSSTGSCRPLVDKLVNNALEILSQLEAAMAEGYCSRHQSGFLVGATALRFSFTLYALRFAFRG